MKYLLYILSTLIITSLDAQTIGDTLYISKDLNKQVIFINAPNSNFHHLVFKYLLNDFEEQKDNLDFTNRKGIIELITIKKYKHKLYAYYPSEPYTNTYIKLTDSNLVINDFNDGLVRYQIRDKQVKGKLTKYHLNRENDVIHSLSIKEKQKGIFTLKSSLFNMRKIDFVTKQDFFQYPIIVNYSLSNKSEEFSFK